MVEASLTEAKFTRTGLRSTPQISISSLNHLYTCTSKLKNLTLAYKALRDAAVPVSVLTCSHQTFFPRLTSPNSLLPLSTTWSFPSFKQVGPGQELGWGKTGATGTKFREVLTLGVECLLQLWAPHASPRAHSGFCPLHKRFITQIFAKLAPRLLRPPLGHNLQETLSLISNSFMSSE